LLALGDARWGTGELDRAKHACAQAAELAEELDDATRLARAALNFCGPYRVDVAAEATTTVVRLLERALAALSDDDSALRAQLTGRLAAGLAYLNLEDGKAALAHQALEMARRLGDTVTLADVLATVEWATRGPDALRENILLAEELGCLADEIGDLRLRVMAHAWLLEQLLERGDIDAVEHELDALQRLAATRTEPYFRWASAVYQANHSFLQGRLEDCERLAHDAVTQRLDGRDELATHSYGAQMFLVRTEQGRLDELLEAVEGKAAKYPELPGWRCILANIYAQLNRRIETRRELEMLAPTDFSIFPRDGLWLSTISVACKPVVFLGDTPRARQLYELLLPYANRCILTHFVMCHGSVSRQLGLLATTLSRYDDAQQHFEQALRMNTQIRSPLWTAHTQHDYAQMLLARGEPSDSDQALDLLDHALATAEHLGLKALADKTRPLKLAAQANPPPQILPRAA
jgi:tetratricopeptide (TPR) repeat protein